MPSTVASHFDLMGGANSFTSRSSYLFLMISVVSFICLLSGFLSRFISSLPDEAINLPNKSFWLSPERRTESLNYISKWLQWFSAGIAGFVCYVHWLVVQANVNTTNQLESVHLYAGLVVLLVSTVVGIVALIMRFRNVSVQKS